MPNQRISELKENESLKSLALGEDLDGNFNNENNDLFLLTAKEKISNNKISFKNFKKSIIDSSLLQAGSQKINGNKTFLDRCKVSNIYEKEFENFEADPYLHKSRKPYSTEIGFKDKSISIKSDTDKSFLIDKTKVAHISKDGCVNIKTERNLGSLSASGDIYIDNIYLKNKLKNNIYQKLPFQDTEDETVCFKLKLQANEFSHHVVLPKVFKYKPIITVNIENKLNQTCVPFIIDSVTNSEFKILFGSRLEGEDYYAHITAHAPSLNPDGSTNLSSDSVAIQRFHTTIQTTGKTHTINFPFDHGTQPTVTTTIETQNNIVPYTISSVNNTSYTLVFSSAVDSSYIVHSLIQ